MMFLVVTETVIVHKHALQHAHVQHYKTHSGTVLLQDSEDTYHILRCLFVLPVYAIK